MLLAQLLLLPVALASSVTVYVHSLEQGSSSKSSTISSPAPLAQIEYDISTPGASLLSYHAPSGSFAPENLLRVGLYDPKTNNWRGVVTSAASFGDGYQKKITVHVDESGVAYHVGFGTSLKEKKTGKENEDVDVEIVKRSKAPQPVLNKPVVLNADGKVEGKEPEKTFLQKYWWALALFLVVQLLAGGSEK